VQRTIYFNKTKREKLNNLKKTIFKVNDIFNKVKIKNLRYHYSNQFFYSKSIGYIYYQKYILNRIVKFHYNNFDFFFIL